MSMLEGKEEEGRREEESKGWFGGAIGVCWVLEVEVERLEAYVGAWFGAMLGRGACQV